MAQISIVPTSNTLSSFSHLHLQFLELHSVISWQENSGLGSDQQIFLHNLQVSLEIGHLQHYRFFWGIPEGQWGREIPQEADFTQCTCFFHLA